MLAFGYGIYEAFSYAYLAKIFPLYISLVLFILATINFIQEIKASRRGARGTSRGAADLESEWGARNSTSSMGATRMTGNLQKSNT